MFEGMAIGGFRGDLQTCRWGNVGGGGVNYCFINIERGLKFTDHISKSRKNEKEKRN